MNNFVIDLWHDLREKRLWPVAVVLLLGLVAVPVMLAKPAEQPEAPAPAPAVQQPADESDKGPAELATVKLAGEEPGAGSTLGVFDPANPFKPPKGAIKKQDDGGSTQGGAETGHSAGPSGSAASDGGSGGDAGAPPVDAPTSPPNSGGGGETPDRPTTTVYRFVADVAFRSGNRTRRIKGMEKLDILPSEASPLLIFMGVTANGDNAVFLVDSTLKAAGEGSCRPSGSECAFLYLGPGSEHEFTNAEGESYMLRVDEIRRVKVGPTAGASRAKGAGRAKGAKASGPLGAPATVRRFVPPLFADLVSVSSGAGADSNTNKDRR